MFLHLEIFESLLHPHWHFSSTVTHNSPFLLYITPFLLFTSFNHTLTTLATSRELILIVQSNYTRVILCTLYYNFCINIIVIFLVPSLSIYLLYRIIVLIVRVNSPTIVIYLIVFIQENIVYLNLVSCQCLRQSTNTHFYRYP